MQEVLFNLNDHFAPLLTALTVEELLSILVILPLPIYKHLFEVDLGVVIKIHQHVCLSVCVDFPLPLIHVK